MSTQKGNSKKSRQQKHQNKTSFKNTKYAVPEKMKILNNLQITGVCQHCKDKIEWKIKYKKYKPLSIPRRCNRCNEKTVKRAYYTVCTSCANDAQVCAMCNKSVPIVLNPERDEKDQMSLKSQQEYELKMMTERERRTFLRNNLADMSAKRKAAQTLDEDDEDDDGDDFKDFNDLEDSSDEDELELKITSKDNCSTQHVSNELDKLTVCEAVR